MALLRSFILSFLAVCQASSPFEALTHAIRDAKSIAQHNATWIADAEQALVNLIDDESTLRAAAEPLDVTYGHALLMQRMVAALNTLADDWAAAWAAERKATEKASNEVARQRGSRPWGEAEQRLEARMNASRPSADGAVAGRAGKRTNGEWSAQKRVLSNLAMCSRTTLQAVAKELGLLGVSGDKAALVASIADALLRDTPSAGTRSRG